jgi:hypothetical protein
MQVNAHPQVDFVTLSADGTRFGAFWPSSVSAASAGLATNERPTALSWM